MQKLVFYSADGQKLSVTDTLTITVRDSVILNRLVNGQEVMLPMSYSFPTDTLVFHFTPEGQTLALTDTVVVSKTNQPHFVSLDCSRSMFHTITSVACSQRQADEVYRYAVATVEIANPQVNYDEKENIRIYFNITQ